MISSGLGFQVVLFERGSARIPAAKYLLVGRSFFATSGLIRKKEWYRFFTGSCITYHMAMWWKNSGPWLMGFDD